MSKLPILSGTKIMKIFLKYGYKKSTSHGDHVTLIKIVDKKPYLVTVPLYKEISRGLLLRIINQSDMTKEEFLKYI